MDRLGSILPKLSTYDTWKGWSSHQVPTPHADFIDNYVDMAPLNGEAFTIDAADVHTYIVNFVAGNETAEAKLLEF
jgi:hypothetical protein